MADRDRGPREASDTWGGLAQGMIELAPFGPGVPDDVKALVNEKQAAIAAGTPHPFAGPVNDNEGKERIKAGETMSDQDMLGFNWYVEGVQGKLPK